MIKTFFNKIIVLKLFNSIFLIKIMICQTIYLILIFIFKLKHETIAVATHKLISSKK